VSTGEVWVFRANASFSSSNWWTSVERLEPVTHQVSSSVVVVTDRGLLVT
jgi:hypothetical protein